MTARLLTNCSNTLGNLHTNARENITRTRAKRKAGYFFVAHSVHSRHNEGKFKIKTLRTGNASASLYVTHYTVKVHSVISFIYDFRHKYSEISPLAHSILVLTVVYNFHYV